MTRRRGQDRITVDWAVDPARSSAGTRSRDGAHGGLAGGPSGGDPLLLRRVFARHAGANGPVCGALDHGGPVRGAGPAAPVGWTFGRGTAMGGEGSEAALEGARIVPATCLGLHVRRASRIVTQIYDAALQPAGLAMNQFSLLVATHLLDGVPMARLARELDCDQTTLSRNLRPLLRRGWVAIQPGQDRRIRQVSLTPAGRGVLEKALPLWERVQAELSEHYGAESWQALLTLLQRTRTLREPEDRHP